MPLRKKLLPSFNGVAAGQTAIVDLELGKRYHVIWLELGDNVGTTLASGNLIGDIRIKINGKVQRTHSGIELNAINLSMGTPFAAKTSGAGATLRTLLPIFFAEPWRNNPKEVQYGAWNARDISSLQIEVDIKAGLVAPVLGGFYEWEPTDKPIGMIAKWIRQTFAAVGAQNDFTTIDRKEFIQAMYLFPTVEGAPKFVNKLMFTANGVIIQDLITNIQNQAILLARELNPDVSATPRFDLVLDYDDPADSALPAAGLQEMTLHVEYNAVAAGNLPVIIQRVGAPE